MKSLKSRINFFIFILLLMTILVFLSYSIVNIRKSMLKKVVENSKIISDIIVLNIKHNNSINNIKQFLNNLLKLKIISMLKITDENNNIVLKLGKSLNVKTIHIKKLWNADYYLKLDKILRLKKQVNTYKKKYNIIIEFPLLYVNKEIKKSILDYTIISFVILTIAYFLVLFITKIITNPINYLIKASEDISNGKYNKINIKTSEIETNKLIDAYNIMIENIKRTFEENKLALLGKMASGIAHEIRNPLVAIKGLTQILIEEEKDKDKIKDLNVILDEVKRLNLFIEKILHFSKPQKLKFSYIKITDVIEDTKYMLKHELNKKHIDIILEVEDDLPEIYADYNSLKQLFINILFNAIYYTKEYDVISIKIYNGDLNKKSIKVEISDKGPGIPKEILKHIFEPFFTHRKKGTGLGLTICKEIMELHNGDISVLSKEGIGTTIVLIFPVKNA